ncbi:unnamed protein product [Rhizophagus irregularis]|nr:unnamed protein product [Rhizophagus irregularis]
MIVGEMNQTRVSTMGLYLGKQDVYLPKNQVIEGRHFPRRRMIHLRARKCLSVVFNVVDSDKVNFNTNGQ